MKFQTTFINGADKTKAIANLESVIEDLEVFMEDIEGNEDTGSFFDYGLSIDYQINQDDEGFITDEYLRYQISWGGPSTEIRFRCNSINNQIEQIEFVYLDWFVGIGFDVTEEECFEWVWDVFISIDIQTVERDKAIEGLYV